MGSHKKHERKKELRRKWKRREKRQKLIAKGGRVDDLFGNWLGMFGDVAIIGLPVYTASGSFVGLVVTQIPDTDEADSSGLEQRASGVPSSGAPLEVQQPLDNLFRAVGT